MTQSIRNIAIIAHVDHGKTTLIDAILKQTAVFAAHQKVGTLIMDSGDLEQERGITITAKNASVFYKDTKINIVDTPGHADFGGEVERALRMVDGVLLLVDAAEGPMPQTKFVLKKALELGCKPIVIVNKIDRPDANASEALDKTLELFLELNVSDDQLDFPVVYASGIDGTASLDVNKPGKDLTPLLELIVSHIPPAQGDARQPLQFLVLNLAYDSFKGRIAIGKLTRGVIRKGESVLRIAKNGNQTLGQVGELLVYRGLERVRAESVVAGDIVGITGFEAIDIGDSITDPQEPRALPPVKVDEPTLQMLFMVNTSPFAGREGEHCTSRKIKERLEHELETNISLRVEPTDSADTFLVSGRGELHLAVLIETMRREGFELAVSKPEVIYKEGPHGKEEPVEQLVVEVSSAYVGAVIEEVGRRGGVLKHMGHSHTRDQDLEFEIPTRGLIGLRGALLTTSKGTAIMHHVFDHYAPLADKIKVEGHGSLVSIADGITTSYALHNIEARGELFIGPQVPVYKGLVIGQSARPDDLEVNPTKTKHLTNVRAAASDMAIQLAPPRELTLEGAIEYIGDDELVEVTPRNVRIRKKILDELARKRAKKRNS